MQLVYIFASFALESHISSFSLWLLLCKWSPYLFFHLHSWNIYWSLVVLSLFIELELCIFFKITFSLHPFKLFPFISRYGQHWKTEHLLCRLVGWWWDKWCFLSNWSYKSISIECVSLNCEVSFCRIYRD